MKEKLISDINSILNLGNSIKSFLDESDMFARMGAGTPPGRSWEEREWQASINVGTFYTRSLSLLEEIVKENDPILLEFKKVENDIKTMGFRATSQAVSLLEVIKERIENDFIYLRKEKTGLGVQDILENDLPIDIKILNNIPYSE